MNKTLLLAFVTGWLLASILSPAVGAVLLVVVVTAIVLILALVGRDQNSQLVMVFAIVLGAIVALLVPDLKAGGDTLVLALFALLFAAQV